MDPGDEQQVAKVGRALIQERVRAGLRHARNKGKHLGRPRLIVDDSKIAVLLAQGPPGPRLKEEGYFPLFAYAPGRQR